MCTKSRTSPTRPLSRPTCSRVISTQGLSGGGSSPNTSERRFSTVMLTAVMGVLSSCIAKENSRPNSSALRRYAARAARAATAPPTAAPARNAAAGAIGSAAEHDARGGLVAPREGHVLALALAEHLQLVGAELAHDLPGGAEHEHSGRDFG